MAARTAIGLTGGIGSGKSTVREWLAEHGAAALDADRVVHDLLRTNGDLVDAVAARFGGSVLAKQADGGIDRPRLAAIVFSDASALRDLEELIHPVVGRYVRAWLREQVAEVAVVEGVKIVESGLHVEMDALWLVVCDRDERWRRLAERGMSPEEAGLRIAADAPLIGRLRVADEVIDNSGSRAATDVQLATAWARLREDSTKGART